MYRILKLAIAAALCWLLTNGNAFTHAMLEHAVPAVGSTVAVPPKEIRLKFSEAVEAAFCRVTVTGSEGAVATGRPHTDGKDKSLLIVDLQGSLKPGVYRVQWKAVSVDTHRTEGSFSFTVRP